MAITGKFVADFEDFTAGVQKADTALQTLQGTGASMTTTFSGNMGTITTAARSTTNVFGTMRDGLSSVDRTLAQFGVNLTPQVAVLGELSTIMQTATMRLGAYGVALGGAAAAAAVFFNRKQIQEWAQEAEDWIAETAANLMGVGAAFRSGQAAAKAYQEQLKHGVGDAKALNDLLNTMAKDEAKRESEQSRTAAKEFSERWREAIEERGKLREQAHKADVAAERDYLNMMTQHMDALGEADKVAMEQAKASAEANAEGLRLMQIDLITFEEETAAAAERARQTEYDAWFKSVNEGVLIVGQAIDATDAKVSASLARTQSAVTSWSQAMMQVNSGLGTLGGTVQSGGMFGATREQIEASAAVGRYFGPVDEFGRPDFSKLHPRGESGAVNVNVNASNSFYDDPASVQRLADKVGTAVMSGLRSRGATV